jgi:predicted DNA-binding antitoxin AbrB/MazE fold protein
VDDRSDIPVTYTNGVFRPDHEVSIPEGSRGFVAVENSGDPTPESRKAAWDLLDRIQREKLIVLNIGRFNRDELYDRR